MQVVRSGLMLKVAPYELLLKKYLARAKGELNGSLRAITVQIECRTLDLVLYSARRR